MTPQNYLAEGSDTAHRQLYDGLVTDPACHSDASRSFLEEQLGQADLLDCGMPSDPASLLEWVRAHSDSVTRLYQRYLQDRRDGAPRRYFSGRAHALWFLRAVAPTKMVDGAWLYATLSHWRDKRFRPLIRTYLEELGDGVQDHNHVAIYRHLVDSHGCADAPDLPDSYYTQGAIQLALGVHGNAFLPEMIGFNLGYEQLPLHLLITAFELDELGIDPWYFTLHATIDNADTGHAEKAVRALQAVWPRSGDASDFLRRVRRGYQLNMLGASTEDIIAAFDLEQELASTLERKARVGALMHSTPCRIGGKPLTQWLQEGSRMKEFLAALEKSGWIVRNRAPEESRFWQLLQGAGAPMFGVFNEYERTLLAEWIVNGASSAEVVPFRMQRKRLANMPEHARPHSDRPRPLLRDRFSRRREHPEGLTELRELEDRLRACPDEDDFVGMLLPLLQPATHASAAGLMATRIFSQIA